MADLTDFQTNIEEFRVFCQQMQPVLSTKSNDLLRNIKGLLLAAYPLTDIKTGKPVKLTKKQKIQAAMNKYL